MNKVYKLHFEFYCLGFLRFGEFFGEFFVNVVIDAEVVE